MRETSQLSYTKLYRRVMGHMDTICTTANVLWRPRLTLRRGKKKKKKPKYNGLKEIIDFYGNGGKDDV